MMRNRPWFVFALVFGWKIALFIFTAQPIPANDAFFYDGAMVHHLLQGGYYNPTIAQAFPFSGHEVFSGYPPLYQVPLMGWMLVFGSSALSVMGMHLFLFGLYLLVLLAIFRRLQTPVWCVNLTGLFLLTFTFHDRPDSVAHLFGALAVYACVRSRRILGGVATPGGGVWSWLMALFVVLTFCTSLQIGGIYLLVVCGATVSASLLGGEIIPVRQLGAMVIVPMLLAVLVRVAWPQLWAGFMEHMRQTPTITGLRMPHWQEVAKIVRSVPAILVIAVLLPVSWFKQHDDLASDTGRRHEILLMATLLPALAILVASLSILTANTVAIANYLQPLVVVAYLALCASMQRGPQWLRFQVICLIPALLLGSVRAVGMTTWGVVCAADVSYSKSMRIIDSELADHPAGYRVVMSSAFLYQGATHKKLDLIHSDWMAKPGGDSRISDSQALLDLRPQKLILTQYDYYRRYQAVLERVRGNPSLKEIQVVDAARIRPPDSIKAWQQVVQHISWAPIVVNLSWRTGS